MAWLAGGCRIYPPWAHRVVYEAVLATQATELLPSGPRQAAITAARFGLVVSRLHNLSRLCENEAASNGHTIFDRAWPTVSTKDSERQGQGAERLLIVVTAQSFHTVCKSSGFSPGKV
jgi:hypothetical protein